MASTMGWWDIADIVRSARSAIQGRLKHNTHVANNASTPVKAVLKFNDDEVAFMTVDPGSYICFPTPKGGSSFGSFPGKRGHSESLHQPKSETARTSASSSNRPVMEIFSLRNPSTGASGRKPSLDWIVCMLRYAEI